MNINLNRVTATTGAVSVCVITAWLGGYDFNSRGIVAACLFFASVAVSLWVFFAPWWKK